MNDLTPSIERETGQVILEGLPAGAAGEAPLVPVPGLDLAFDRADGRLCRAVVDATGTDGRIAVGEQVAAILVQVFGAQAPSVVSRPAEARSLSPEPGLTAALSSLARLDAARATSPIPPASPWWAAEAAELAERAGLHARARAEATIGGTRPPSLAAPPHAPALDVAAEVENLEKDRVRLAGLQWMLDPDLVPAGVFRPGLSPYSDLLVCDESAQGRVIVEALLAPGADRDAPGRCLARLVDPSVRRILAQAAFTMTPSGTRAELRLPFPLDEVHESWIEVVQDKHWPVRSGKGHRIRRALRWADAALRAERAPVGLAPQSTPEDWAALAAVAWEQCRRDWEAAGDADRAYLAAVRQAALDGKARTCVPQPPSAIAAEIARQVPIDGPGYLAEALGRLHQRAPGPASRGPTASPRLKTRRRSPPAPAGSHPMPPGQPGRSRRGRR